MATKIVTKNNIVLYGNSDDPNFVSAQTALTNAGIVYTVVDTVISAGMAVATTDPTAYECNDLKAMIKDIWLKVRTL